MKPSRRICLVNTASTETLVLPASELEIGSIFARRYEVLRKLGSGGMGQVYEVLDTEINERIALKILKPEIACDEHIIRRFKNELKLARKIRHKNVCQMFQLERYEGTHFITMELVSGKNLKALIKGAGRLSVDRALHIAHDICEGLGAAHSLGVIHRDLKPQNIMIDRQGIVRIMDFGIARSIETGSTAETGRLLGTPEFMSPEQISGQDVDQRSDIYAMGVLLFEMVTSKPPFEGTTPISVALQHLSSPPPDPRTLDPSIDEGLARLILRCLEKDRADRYQSAQELADNLTHLLPNLPAFQQESMAGERKIKTRPNAYRWLRRRRLPLLIISASCLGILILVWMLTPRTPREPGDPRPSLAIVNFENKTGDSNLDRWRSILAELLTVDLSQSKFLRILPSDRVYEILKALRLLETNTYSAKELAIVAATGGVQHILRGSLIRNEAQYILTVVVKTIKTGEAIVSHSFVAQDQNDLFTKVIDEASRDIKSVLGVSDVQIKTDIDREIGTVLSASPKAYEFYSAARKLHLDGKYNESLPLLEKAIAADPEFAMAYRALAMAYGNLHNYDKQRECLQKAFDFRHRISDRERWIIEGDFYRNSGEKYFLQAIESYSKFLEAYPADFSWYNNYGLVYYELEDWEKTSSLFNNEWIRKPQSIQYFFNQGLVDCAQGRYSKARELWRRYLRTIRDDPRLRRSLAFLYIWTKDFDRCLIEAKKAEALSPRDPANIQLLGDIFLYKGDLTSADKEFHKLVLSDDPSIRHTGLTRLMLTALERGKIAMFKSWYDEAWALMEETEQYVWEMPARSLLGYALLGSGDAFGAQAEFETLNQQAKGVGNLSFQRRALVGKGLSFLDLGRIAEAQKAAEELKDICSGSLNKKIIRYHLLLDGMIDLRRLKLTEGVSKIEEAVSLLPYEHEALSGEDQAIFLEALGRAYREIQNPEKAKDIYIQLAGLTTGRLCFGNIYVKSYFYLGDVLEMKGSRAEAARYYKEFLKLCQEADAGIAEVGEAQKRLADFNDD